MGNLVRCEAVGEIALVTLDNPPVNAFAAPLVAELDRTLDELASARLRAVVITGAGRAFQAGADINEFFEMKTKEAAAAIEERSQALIGKVAALGYPVIAAVNGLALGGGMELALACDVRIASTAATFALPEVSRGVIPGAGGTQRLARLVGPGRAKMLIFSAMRIDADEALRIGLVDAVVQPEALIEEAMGLARKIGQNSPTAVRATKAAIDGGFDLPLSEGLALERACFLWPIEKGDHLEGARAFFEKRQPSYSV